MTLVDEHINSFNSPFKFNGKEYDEETGNYYYSARYYDPKLSIFISVDPLADETFSAYGYCYNNPVRFVDPTGMMGYPPTIDSEEFITNQISNGTNWLDSDGSWTYNANSKTWEGIDGTDYNVAAEVTELDEVVINADNSESVLDMVSSFKIEGKITFEMQASFEGEVLDRKAGFDGNIASLTLLRGSYEQQQSDYHPGNFDGFSYLIKMLMEKIFLKLIKEYRGYWYSFRRRFKRI